MKIFLSHSSKDLELVRKLIELLRSSLGFLPADIRCTSLEGYRLPGGANTDEALRVEVESADVVIAVLSTSSLASLYVIFELGARWGIKKPLIPLLVPGLSASKLSRPLSGLNVLRGELPGDLHQLVSDLAVHFEIAPQPPASYERYIQELSRSTAGSSSETTTPEETLYWSNGRDLGFDFKGGEAQLWQKIDGTDQPVSGHGKGSLSFGDGFVLNIQRTNTDGRYEVRLRSYAVNKSEQMFVPRNDLMTGLRRFRISCEAKAVGAEHTLRFVLKNERSGMWIANDERTITSNNWTPIRLYFQIPPSEEFELRIDDMNVTHAPSSVQNAIFKSLNALLFRSGLASACFS